MGTDFVVEVEDEGLSISETSVDVSVLIGSCDTILTIVDSSGKETIYDDSSILVSDGKPESIVSVEETIVEIASDLTVNFFGDTARLSFDPENIAKTGSDGGVYVAAFAWKTTQW